MCQIKYEDETTADDDDNSPEESNTQEDQETKETEEDEDDEDDVDETTNVRKKHDKRSPGGSAHSSKAKAITRRKKRYNLQFTFDADVRCAVTIYYFCTEEITAQVSYF